MVECVGMVVGVGLEGVVGGGGYGVVWSWARCDGDGGGGGDDDGGDDATRYCTYVYNHLG